MFPKTPTFKSPFTTFGKVALGVGALFVVIGLVVYFVLQNLDESFASIIVISVVGGKGVLWLLIGTIFTGISKRADRKLYYLKEYGDYYEAEEISLVSSMHITSVSMDSGSLGLTTSVYALCVYTNSQGQRCRVKSRMFMWNRWGQEHETLRAVIYVDRQDPSLYAVEMIYQEPENSQVDVDYT